MDRDHGGIKEEDRKREERGTKTEKRGEGQLEESINKTKFVAFEC